MTDIALLSMTELAAAYRDKSLTPSAVIGHTLERISKLDPKLGAFEIVTADRAVAAADAATKAIASGHRIGPFHGIPFALKDLVDFEGLITTGGTNAKATNVATSTATIAARLIAGGGILIGKTKTVEVAYGAWGTNTRRGTPWNPWDATTHRTPGGSSSGSGVAVASGMASCAIGTDTGGSVRIPAGWCGIVGLKVTEGRLPLEGIVPLSHTLDTPGPMARTVADATLMYETLLGRPPDAIDADIAAGSGLYGQINAGVAGLRMGALSAVAREGVDAAVLADYDAALARLKALGAEIVTFDLPVSASDMARGVGMIISAEGYYHHGSLYEDPANAMDEHVRPRIMAGAKISARDYVAVRQQMQTNRRATLAAMHDAKLAVFLTPTITTPPVPVADADQTKTPAGFTRAVNYLGFCAMSVPMGLAGANLPTGLPTSLHVVARGGDEAMAIRVSGAFERDRGPFPPPPMALG